MDGVLDEDEDDLERIMNGRLTAYEYAKASAAKQQNDDDKGDHEFTTEQMGKPDEDLWYLLNANLEGVEPRGKLNGFREGSGLQAYHKIYKWYSAVTGVAPISQDELGHEPGQAQEGR